jgi:hypothetical protein
MDRETLQRIDTLLIGYKCSGIERLGENYLQVLFGERRLIVECAWRLSDQGEIVIGNESEETVLSKIDDLVVGSVVREVRVRGEFHDLRVKFANARVLEAFADSEKYENWNLVTSSGEMIIAGPSRLWSTFRPPA